VRSTIAAVVGLTIGAKRGFGHHGLGEGGGGLRSNEGGGKGGGDVDLQGYRYTSGERLTGGGEGGGFLPRWGGRGEW